MRFSLAQIPATLIAFTCTVFGQPKLEWVQKYAIDQGKVNQSRAIVRAPDRSVIVAGSSANANGDLDYVVIKYASNGEQKWLRRFDDGGANDFLRRQAIDPSGNVTVTGTSKTVSYDLNGNLRWVAPFGARDLAVDADYVYVTGFSEVDFATAKLRGLNGTNIWTQTLNGINNDVDISQVITLDTNSNVYVAGSERWYCDRSGCREFLTLLKYSPSGGVLVQHHTSFQNFNADAFIEMTRLLYDQSSQIYISGRNGHYPLEFWTYQYSLQLDESPWFWALDKDDGHGYYGHENDCISDGSGTLYLVGRRDYNVAPIPIVITLVKLKPDGHKAWRVEYGNPFPGLQEGKAVLLDSQQNAYVAGYVQTEANGTDIVLIKYDKDGNRQWVQTYDGPAHRDDIATGVTQDENGNLYVTGYSVTTVGGSEMITLKYSQFPKIEKQSSGAMHLQYLTDPNASYVLQATTNFFDWTNLLTNSADGSGLVQFDDPNVPAAPLRVYRGKAAQ